MTMTTVGRLRSAVVIVLALGVLAGGALEAAPAMAHGEGLTPYLYVTAPPGVVSAGTPEPGVAAASPPVERVPDLAPDLRSSAGMDANPAVPAGLVPLVLLALMLVLLRRRRAGP